MTHHCIPLWSSGCLVVRSFLLALHLVSFVELEIAKIMTGHNFGQFGHNFGDSGFSFEIFKIFKVWVFEKILKFLNISEVADF